MKTMEYKWNEFGKVRTEAQLTSYLNGREYNHGAYCHYTSLKTIDAILNSQKLRLSCVSGFNDLKDRGQFKNEKYFYSFCFATGINENLPLWYMYAGRAGKGGRLRFTSNQIKLLLEKATYTLVELEDKVETAGTVEMRLDNDSK